MMAIAERAPGSSTAPGVPSAGAGRRFGRPLLTSARRLLRTLWIELGRIPDYKEEAERWHRALRRTDRTPR
jgi:hypothetical protein